MAKKIAGIFAQVILVVAILTVAYFFDYDVIINSALVFLFVQICRRQKKAKKALWWNIIFSIITAYVISLLFDLTGFIALVLITLLRN